MGQISPKISPSQKGRAKGCLDIHILPIVIRSSSLGLLEAENPASEAAGNVHARYRPAVPEKTDIP
jgi:hypothetical protein